MSARYEIKKGGDGYYFEFRVGADTVLLKSGRYASLAACKKGIASLRRTAASPLEDVDGICFEPTGRLCAPKYSLSRVPRGMIKLRLVASNGRTVAESAALPPRDRTAVARLTDALRVEAPYAATEEKY